ncbi:MAG: type II toxin-antitoxin system PemK/MazF family toxin [Epsilonproteobacteria bacterium]|nr:MAG: type II toxin-antitoxin system PemK/MazF family toxin [Campylobacterota bacterium]
MTTRDIYLVDLNPTKGAETKKARPCIIVSNDDVGILPLKVVVPLIGHKDIHNNKSWLIPIDVTLENGLAKKSTADALNIRSVSDTRIIKRIGVLDEETYLRLLHAMKIVLNMV